MSFIPGANVGPYRIVEQAERSGVATTYIAYQPSIGQYVSVVVVPTMDRDDLSLLRQYQRQIELVLKLRHPNLLTVLDHGEHLGEQYIVTESVEAEPLSERLGAPWPIEEVVRVLRPIAAGLDYAHGRGVVHGDVRPTSLCLMPDGTPILSGLGLLTRRLAPRNGGSHGVDGTSASTGSLEIAEAQQSDRRGLALIAYEMLTGRTVDVEPAELEEPFPPAHFGSPLLAAPVERTLLRELSGGLSERYPSAAAFVTDLAASMPPVQPVGVTPPLPPVPMSAVPSGDANRRLVTVAVIFTALAVLGLLALLLRGGEPSRPIAAPNRPPGADASPGATMVGSTSTDTSVAAKPGAGASTADPVTSTPGAPSATSATGSTTDVTPGAPTSAVGVVVPTVDVVRPQPSPTIVTATGPSTSPPQPGGPPASSGAPPGSGLPPAPTPPASTGSQPTVAASTRIPATWRVTGDPSGRWTLGDQGHVAGQISSGGSLVLFPESVEDVTYSALVSTTSCHATLVFRAQDDENLMMAIYIPDGLPNPTSTGGGIWLYQRVEGLDLPIRAVRPSTMGRVGEAVRLQVMTSGSQITVSLNDEAALEAFDTTPRSGRLGMMVYSADGRLCDATYGEIQR